MADPLLAPRPAWAGLDLPLGSGGVTLAAGPEAPLWAVTPHRGQAGAVGEALGAALPEPGASVGLPGGGRLIWAGLDQWLLRGLAPDLTGHAAVTDVSDGWTALALTGRGAAETLARLVPIDLTALTAGATARTQLGHMMCLILARPDGFELMVLRSFTRTAVEEIVTAMRSVAARARL